MSSQEVLHALGYDKSPNYLDMVGDGAPLESYFSHVYRKAIKECGLQGVYVINDKPRETEVPVVFYCQATDEAEARKIHQKVWNQDIAPFVLVETPAMLRLYCGFRYNPYARGARQQGILKASIAFNEIANQLQALSSDAIDCGRVWDVWEEDVTSNTRVDRTLLSNLKKLETALRSQGLSRAGSHALIGKFVYLKYLRDRDILSDQKLKRWGIEPSEVFGRNATIEAFYEVNRRLDAWLNGSVFPLEPDIAQLPHLRFVAGIFKGDEMGGQLHLNFEPYDFSFIPIETLSVIYQQFLHAEEKGKENRGRKAGAYYTPLPLVNYILNELESRYPLKEGMRVLDPSCGSGAFLVQCYRALIEKRRQINDSLRPVELRDLLVKHIYGVDRDGDACQVAELSLILTLLDYTTPPDLENSPQFKLPILRNRNIYQADFFDDNSEWAHASNKLSFDWVVGNPPWVPYSKDDVEDRYVRDWVNKNSTEFPIVNSQIAEAFVWRSLPLLKNKAVAGLVLPAMTLFKEKKSFRQKLFNKVRVWCVANFSNLRFVLFSESTRPAMTIFFTTEDENEGEGSRIRAFTPFVINQRANRTTRKGNKKQTWNIVVNGSEVREITHAETATGDIIPWKMAMWGTYRDRKLLRRIEHRFPKLTDFLNQKELFQPSEGFQIRNVTKLDEEALANNPVEHIPDLEGREKVLFEELKGCGRIFTFPRKSISKISREEAYIRIRGGKAGIVVSEPPHIIVDAMRRFAIFSDEFVAIPARQIGIAGPAHSQSEKILKALSVYLSSDFVTYQQFLTTTEWGISSPRATLKDLKSLPVPLGEMSQTEIHEWADLRDTLAKEGADGQTVSHEVLGDLNQKVNRLLGLEKSEQTLIEDFIHWNMTMIDGEVPSSLTIPPDDQSIEKYLVTLRNELDLFISNHAGIRHKIEAARDNLSAILAISLTTTNDTSPSVYHLDDEDAKHLKVTRAYLLKRHSQWLYFNRDLRVYDRNTVYLFKPLERIHWTQRQAILDAGEVIAEILGQVNNQ